MCLRGPLEKPVKHSYPEKEIEGMSGLNVADGGCGGCQDVLSIAALSRVGQSIHYFIPDCWRYNMVKEGD